MRYQIYSADGTPKIQTASVEYKGEWMGARNVTVSVTSAVPVTFVVGDYLLYRGERFELNVLPSVQKQANSGTYGEAYTYENIKFDALTDELVRCMFFDCTLSQGATINGVNSKFSFYCADVTELANRIQANLNRLYTGLKHWTIQIAEGYSPSADKERNITLTADNMNCWQALSMAYEQMGVKFVIEKQTRTITFGTSGTVHDTFLFGKGHGLRKITKASEQNQNIVTKVRAYGNTTNMPQHYYYYKVLHCVCTPTYIENISKYVITVPNGYTSTDMLFLIRNNDVVEEGVYRHKIKVNNNYQGTELLYEGYKNLHYDSDLNAVVIDGLYSEVGGGRLLRVEILTANKHYIPLPFKQSDVADNTALIPVKNLMLTGYPLQTLDPYILSDNAAQLGIREAVVYFDGSNDNDDIYPTLSNVTMKDIEDAGYTTYIATEDVNINKANIRLDAILDASRKPVTPITRAEDYNDNALIDDDGIFDDESSFTDADGHFLVRIRNIGFDLASADVKLSSTEYPVLSMKDGMCGGREFNIVDCKLSSDSKYYTLQCERVKDDSLNQFFPNRNALIRKDDRFIIANINMPDVYIDAASAKLATAARLWLSENETTSYQYNVELDNIFLARQHDYALAHNDTSIHDTIKEGDILCIEDDDLSIENAIEIANLTIREGKSAIPEYSVTLRSEKSASSLQKIQNTIKGIVDGSVSIAGVSIPQIKDIVNTTIKNLKLEEKFLNKTSDDTAKGNYNFYGDIIMGDPTDNVKNFTENVKGAAIKWNGSGWTIFTDYLHVSKKAFFKELEIDKVFHIGGQQILTACGCKIEHVFYFDNKWFVFFAKEDADGNAISNDWKVGDLAYCQSFNVGVGVTENAGNRYYWVRVTDVEPSAYGPYMSQGVSLPDMSERTTGSWDSSDLFNSSNYHCIAWQCIGGSNSDSPSINSSTPCAISSKLDSDTPKAGDNIVLLGHIKQPSETVADAEARQGATLLAGAGTWGQALIMWRGIGADANNPFIMPEPQVVISPQRVKVVADDIALSSSGRLLLSSDQLTCTNTDGDKTMWLDALGNVNIAGILNRMQIEIEGDKFDYFFNSLDDEVVPTYPDEQNAPDTLLFSDDDGAVMLTHLQEQDSNNIYDPSQWNNGILRVPDMLRMDGIVRLGYETSSDNNGVYDRGEQYQIVFPFIFPYEREMQLDGINYNVRYETCRTATSANGTRHLMTWNELNSIVGRKITFENNGARVLIVYPSFTKEGLVTQENGELVTRTVYTFNCYNLTYASRLGFTIEYVSGIVKHSINGNDYELDRGIFPFLTDITQAQYPTAEDWGEVI